MHNYGVIVEREMSEDSKLLLEQNIQQSLAQKEIDLEDAMAIRRLKDLDQAEKLLIIRRKRKNLYAATTTATEHAVAKPSKYAGSAASSSAKGSGDSA